MYIDDIKILAKSGKELETFLQTIRIYSQDVGMEFGIEKCTMIIIKKEKREVMEAIELSNQKSWRKWKLQIPGDIRSRHYQTEIKDKT